MVEEPTDGVRVYTGYERQKRGNEDGVCPRYRALYEGEGPLRLRGFGEPTEKKTRSLRGSQGND